MNELFAFNLGYLLVPLLGGIGVAVLAGPLGAFMVWRRLAYFGDTLSHSGLLGITLAFALHINIVFGVCLIAISVACLLLKLQTKLKVASDTILGLLSHTTLALGLLVLSLMQDLRVDVLGFLYGDILTISLHDLLWIYGGGFLILLGMLRLWQRLLLLTVDADLAKVEGVAIERVELMYMILLAVVIAIAIKLVGVLLITALLIIPVASARPLARSPEAMAFLGSCLGALSVFLGLLASHFWDLPCGPAIVVISALMLVLTTAISSIKKSG
ncbi:MAG: metal ABC transporter permease [Proteobacteria bacterium]|nr:metal ABC transporter permease [Pseudomonadota bacterium]